MNSNRSSRVIHARAPSGSSSRVPVPVLRYLLPQSYIITEITCGDYTIGPSPEISAWKWASTAHIYWHGQPYRSTKWEKGVDVQIKFISAAGSQFRNYPAICA